MTESEWITTNQLKVKCGVEDFQIMVAVKERRLVVYNSSLIKINEHQVMSDRKEADRMNDLAIGIGKKHFEDPQNPKYYPTWHYYVLADCLFKKDAVQKIWNKTKSEPRKDRRRDRKEEAFRKAKELKREKPSLNKTELYCHPEIIKIYGGESEMPTLKTFRDRHMKGL